MAGRVALFLTLALGVSFASKTNAAGIYVLPEQTETFNLSVPRVWDLAKELSTRYGMPICVEESRWYARITDAKDYSASLEVKRSQGITLVGTNVTLQTALDQFVRDHADYTWQFDQTNGIANLYPVHQAAAGWLVSVATFHTQNLEEVTLASDLLGLRDHGISIHTGTGSPRWALTNSISIDARDATLRSILNRITDQLPENRYWTICEKERESVFWDGTKRTVIYTLRFWPFQSAESKLKISSPE